ncbi:L,D-transpeptidase [Vannielia litorea]|uniref:L,D-transpeptidase catalytic domain n=1 Tax=Vannielia litorea TaxID=1217970 RepID=A0A1N6FX41_9RHOB|nr:L,D-transpeptidase [Vannielia litorea]SIN99772.1 L,D-transpeptidase catalytic domain [Vannielia litorea]
MKRRDFIAGSAALLGGTFVAGAPALAFDETLKPYGLPIELLPHYVNVSEDLAPQEIHVSPSRFALFLTLGGGRAIRYTCGIGRPGLYEPGTFFVGARKQWPAWTPTPDMIERDPAQYKRFEDGMPGGPANPLGARALYLFKPQIGDTFLRIHGTNDPRTIGKRVSNGCARLVNNQIVHLYRRTPMNAKVVLYPASENGGVDLSAEPEVTRG